MIGIVLVTHGRLAAEFVEALEHVVGPQAQIAAVCVGPDDDMEKRRQDILRSIASVDTGEGAVLLTDMFGGTPSNLAISGMDRAKIRGDRRCQLADVDKARQSAPERRDGTNRSGCAGGGTQIHQRCFAVTQRCVPMSGR